MLFSWRDWIFSLKAFMAAIMAVFIALSLDLPRPYWAMAAVYIVANPLAGATASKGLYRALGTLLGASAAVFLVPVFVNAPELLSLAVALWTGSMLFISMLDRTARSYVFMLAGYTLPLIALPSVGAPESIFDTALARAEEITIGIVCASIVSSVVFPVSVRTALSGRLSSWLDDAGNWAEEILRGEGASPATPIRRQKLAADVLSLDLMMSQLGYDAGARDIARHAQELRGRLMMMLPLLSSLADRLHALKASIGALPDELASVLNEAADWLKTGSRSRTGQTADDITTTLDKLENDSHGSSWNALLRASALARLKEIVQLWDDCLSLRDQIAQGRQAASWTPAFRKRRVIARIRHYDFVLLAFAASGVSTGILAASAFWIASGWQNGASFVALTAVACSFFAATDRPAPLIVSMFVWTGVSLVVAFVYLFVILPSVDSFELLVIVLAPPFLLLGLMITKQRYTMLAVLIAVNSANFIALQSRYSADFSSFINEAIAALCGVGFALVWTLVTRPFGAELAARRLLKAGWSDLAETAAGGRKNDQATLSARSLDRLGQLVPRLAAIDDPELKTVDGYADIRLGFNVLMLQSERELLSEGSRALIDDMLARIADLYRDRSRQGRPIAASEPLLRSIDDCLRAVAIDERSQSRASIDALVGLRRALFPDSAPPQGLDPEEHDPPASSLAAE